MYNRKYRHNVYMFCGSIYNMNDCIIENPALLIDKSDGCVHGYGDAENLTAKFVNMAAAYNSAGLKDMADDLLLMDFSNAYYKGVSNEEICYILRRAVEYTASSTSRNGSAPRCGACPSTLKKRNGTEHTIRYRNGFQSIVTETATSTPEDGDSSL